ncbi:UPF0518 protein v1g243165-like [Zerene cesonia]|uniref:UPF0518 protein v1g243165-like n=1 Tax=Zerene cesonia TaxID=33412 RepID=UPI0018E5A1D5|nr:UPF0518 protein v1g243165-like [Zerene cesonia]
MLLIIKTFKNIIFSIRTQLSLVTLSLMETLIDLNCEDVMIELVFKYLLNGHHLISPHKHKLSDPENFREAAMAFLDLQPKCCQRPLVYTRQWVDDMALSGKRVLDLRPGDESRVNGVHGDIAMNNLVQEINFDYGNPNETLIGNYHAYLSDSRVEIVTRTIACSNWSSRYAAVAKREPNNNAKDKEIETSPTEDSLVSICTSGYETLKTSDTSEKEHSLNSLVEEKEDVVEKDMGGDKEDGNKEHDSLTSFGESSGYDSFKYRDECEGYAEDSFKKSFEKEGDDGSDCDAPVRSWRINVETIIGPLLAQLLKKVSLLLESDVATNCRVTSVIYKLCSFPEPLLVSLLLCPAFILPNLPSLYQILNKLREEIDELVDGMDNIPELVDMARVFLIQREMALVRRALTNDDNKAQRAQTGVTFQRSESKRRSLSSSISNMFARKVPPSPPQINMNYTPLHTQKRPAFTQESYWNQSIKLRSILNAVILDEWLKELSSLCQEQALRLSAEYYEDESFIRTLAL